MGKLINRMQLKCCISLHCRWRSSFTPVKHAYHSHTTFLTMRGPRAFGMLSAEWVSLGDVAFSLAMTFWRISPSAAVSKSVFHRLLKLLVLATPKALWLWYNAFRSWIFEMVVVSILCQYCGLLYYRFLFVSSCSYSEGILE